MVADRDPRALRRPSPSLFLREPARGFNEQEAVLGRTLDDDDEPPVRLSSVAARLKKVRTFRYLTLGIGMLGFALVSVPVRLSFLFDESYGFSAYKRGWVLSLTYVPALLVIPIAGRYGDRLFRRDPRWAVRLFGWLVVGVRRLHHLRTAAERGRAADRASSRSRTRASSPRSRRSGRRSRPSSRTGCEPRRSR